MIKFKNLESLENMWVSEVFLINEKKMQWKGGNMIFRTLSRHIFIENWVKLTISGIK